MKSRLLSGQVASKRNKKITNKWHEGRVMGRSSGLLGRLTEARGWDPLISTWRPTVSLHGLSARVSQSDPTAVTEPATDKGCSDPIVWQPERLRRVPADISLWLRVDPTGAVDVGTSRNWVPVRFGWFTLKGAKVCGGKVTCRRSIEKGN